MRRVFAVVVLCGVTFVLGCANRQGFERRMSAFVGQPEVNLVQALGVPARTFEVGNRRFLQYERRRIQADSLPGWGWGGGVSVQTWDCSTTFEIVEGKVADFSSRGNDCVATNPS